MASPTPMRCLKEECPHPLGCHFRMSCREAVADVWRSVALGFETLRSEGRFAWRKPQPIETETEEYWR